MRITNINYQKHDLPLAFSVRVSKVPRSRVQGSMVKDKNLGIANSGI
jgi:hypothetical protein